MNYYELLEVSPHASKEVLRAAYKSLMQRHHPDKHQADSDHSSAMARRAALIVQAYAVLSDADQRAAYDAQLQHTPVRPPPPTGYTAPPTHRAPAPASPSNWYLWLLATVILASGVLIWTLSGQQKPAPPAAATVRTTAAPASPVTAATAASADPATTSPAATTTVQTLSLLNTELRVVLVPTNPLADGLESRRHILFVPAVTVEIGSIESEKFASLLAQNQDAVVQKLSDKLAYASYTELKIDGDKYLARLVTDALRDITGTRGLDDKPSTGSPDTKRYGVVAVSLPASFVLH